MKRQIILILMVVTLLVTACGKKESLDKDKATVLGETNEHNDIVNEENLEDTKESKELSKEDKDRYITESNIMDYIPEGINYDLNFVYLQGQEIPEIICTYNTDGTSLDWESRIIILSYEENEEKWIKIFEEDKSIMESLAVIGTNDNNEIALYNHASGGTAGLIGVEIVKYDSDNKIIKLDMISSSISFANYPEYLEEDQAVYFKGFSHGEKFTWNGEKFQHEILKIPVDIGSDIEIHFTIENGKAVFDDRNMFTSPLKVNKGDIITFIQDDPYGGLDRFGSSDGLRNHEKSDTSLIVTGEGMQHVSMRINAEWYEFKIQSGEETVSHLAGEPLSEDDLKIRTNHGIYLSMDSTIKEIMDLLEGGEKTELGVSPYDSEIIFYSLKKDGINFLYYAKPSDPSYATIFDTLVIDSADHSTFRGLKIGDSYEEVTRLYGKSGIIWNDEDTTNYLYSPSVGEESFYALIITINNKINAVTHFNISPTF